MWTIALANETKQSGTAVIAVNPGSLLGSKMVTEGFGIAGGDLNIGADIFVRSALSDDFANASGKYFDNDSGEFNDPHSDTQHQGKVKAVVDTIEEIIKNK